MAEFADGLPGWLDKRTGMPLSWQHFQYGLAAIRRLTVRKQIALHNAVFMAKSKAEDRKAWMSDLMIAAGYRDT